MMLLIKNEKVKNISLMCNITIGSSSSVVEDILREWDIIEIEELRPSEVKSLCKILFPSY